MEMYLIKRNSCIGGKNMNCFEVGRILGRLDVILENIPNKEVELERVEWQLLYNNNITELAKVYGRVEQLMIDAHKDNNDIANIKDLFMEIKQKYIDENKKRNIEEFKIRGLPVKALKSNNIYTVEDLCNKTYKELAEINGVSELTVRNISNDLEKYGLQLKNSR